MPDHIQLIVVLRKTVADEAEAQALYQIVKDRFADNPSISVTGKITNHLEAPPELP